MFGGPPLTSSTPPWDVVSHHQAPTALFGTTASPFPTNVWWQNMVLDDGELASVVNPYIVKTKYDGLHVCLPYLMGAERWYAMGCSDWLVMSSLEVEGTHAVAAHDELSVTVAWSGMEAPIVRGMPYATVFYNNTRPTLRC